MKVAVVGATGLVGSLILKVLEERGFPADELVPCASERSLGKELSFKGKALPVVSVQAGVDSMPDLAIFSAGAEASRQWAPVFAEKGSVVIDNSSAWRMDADKKLIVPEVNASVLTGSDKIIANPNCSTIQMVVALAPLHKRYGIRRLVISTYQSVTGSGIKGIRQLKAERRGNADQGAYPHPIDLNCLPHGGTFDVEGYTTEERKLEHETRKILADNKIAITATVVRVPVFGGHSESVNVELSIPYKLEALRSLLAGSPGIEVLDEPDKNLYPMPLTAEGSDAVFVGRLRRDASAENALNIWIVSDNLRKGAATNAVQIAEYMVSAGLL